MGDIYQAVYKYKGADSRYLTLADRCFPTLKTSWVWVIGFRIIEVVRGINNIFYNCSVWGFIAQRGLSLSISYRLTANMALFINEVLYVYITVFYVYRSVFIGRFIGNNCALFL